MKKHEDKYIVFFDGVCGLCNHLVDYLMKVDKRKRLMYSPIQGETAKELLDPEVVKSFDTLIFWDKGKPYYKSSGALRIFRRMGGSWSLLFGFIIVPVFIRNVVYNFIAKRRYKWYGKKEACRLPTPEERARFLP